jgi:hypothetical protein
VLLIATPRDGAEGVEPSAEIWVQFAPVAGKPVGTGPLRILLSSTDGHGFMSRMGFRRCKF